jgi:hypothetical protein
MGAPLSGRCPRPSHPVGGRQPGDSPGGDCDVTGRHAAGPQEEENPMSTETYNITGTTCDQGASSLEPTQPRQAPMTSAEGYVNSAPYTVAARAS